MKRPRTISQSESADSALYFFISDEKNLIKPEPPATFFTLYVSAFGWMLGRGGQTSAAWSLAPCCFNVSTLLESKVHLKNIGDRAYTPSRVLVPGRLMDYYTKRCKHFGGRANYLQHLIRVYGRHLEYYGLSPYAHKWKKKYQEKGLDLQKCDFVPEPSDKECLL